MRQFNGKRYNEIEPEVCVLKEVSEITLSYQSQQMCGDRNEMEIIFHKKDGSKKGREGSLSQMERSKPENLFLLWNFRNKQDCSVIYSQKSKNSLDCAICIESLIVPKEKDQAPGAEHGQK